MATIGELGERIATLAKKIGEDQKQNDVSSVDPNTTIELAEASRELEQLVLGPRQTLGMMGLSIHDASSLGVIVNFDIPNLVPSQGSISFAELSAQCGLDEDRLTRVLRYAMINHIFREEPAGHVRHTPLSTHLAQSPVFCDFLRTLANVFHPACASLPTALSRWPQTRSMTEAAHGVARQTDLTFYDWLEREENAVLRLSFDKGMEGISRGGQRLQDTDLRAYPWRELREGGGGCGCGHFARDLSEAHPSFSIIVQDLPRVIRQTIKDQKRNSSSFKSVTYQAHNCFEEQPVKAADVYFMRHVFHNHPDAECVTILKALLPALKPGARVLVSEYIVPPSAELSGGLSTKAMRQLLCIFAAAFHLVPTSATKRLRNETLLITFTLEQTNGLVNHVFVQCKGANQGRVLEAL
ncbi:s-adenosyl-l-methionine-dependent methyltransferase [Apiospora arundinis]